MDLLKPLGITLGRGVEKLVEAVEIVGSVENIAGACRYFVDRNKRTTRKPVADAVKELLKIKEAHGASKRYLEDLKSRLTRFSHAFQKDVCAVTTADIQAWFDAQKFGTQNLMGYRRVIHLLFEFAIARGYAIDNPAAKVERVKVKHGQTEVFTPEEITRLLASASPAFLPCIAIGAFAGLRSAEIERLEWSDIDLAANMSWWGRTKQRRPPAEWCPFAIIWGRGWPPLTIKRGLCGMAIMRGSTTPNRPPPRLPA